MPFIAPIITAIGTWWGGTALGSFLASIGLTGKVLLTIGLNIAASLIQRALIKKPQGGVQFERQYGGDVQRTVAIGIVGLAGHDCYINTYGKSNKFLQQIYVIADYPCDSLKRVAINGTWQTLGTTEDPEKGFPITSGDFANLIHVKFFPGTHTAANDYLIDNANPDTRWTENHIGVGICYVLVSMVYDQKKNASFPDFFFEVRGAKLYDWRKDSTAGGTGSHRWNNPATHEFSENPIVADYNYRRGFSVNGDLFCGMDMPPSDLPLDKYTTAANICDETVSAAPRYRVSLFLDTMSTHGDNIETLMTSCGGMVVDGVDGSWPIVGTDQPIVAILTDDDLITGASVSFQAKRSMAELVNSVSGNYPHPDEIWSMIGYEPQIDATAVVVDRRTRDLNLDFPQVPYVGQAEQLASIYLLENRYEANATITVRPRYQGLQAGDWILWNSARYGNKTYMVTESTLYSLESDGPRNVLLTLQERSGTIYDGIPPSVPIIPTPPGERDLLDEVEGFSVIPVIVEGDTGSKRPALRASWDIPTDETVSQVVLKWFPTAQPDSVFYKTVDAGENIVVLLEGIVRSTEYRVQSRIITIPERTTVFSAGVLVTSPDVGTGIDDLDPTPPSVPTGLTLSSAIDENSPGYVILHAEWDANPPEDFVANYDLQIREDSGNFVSFLLTTTEREFRILSGVNVQAKVRAINGLGMASAFSAVVSHLTTADTTPPAVPTGLVATPGFGVIWLEWTPNAEPDLAYYEIYQSATATPAPSTGTPATFKNAGNQLVISGLDSGITRHYWVRALDRSGNKSAWSSRVQATTTTIDIPDITPPTLGVPGIPSLSEITQIDDAGNPVTNIQAVWTAGTNAVSYEVGVTPYGGNEVVFGVGALRFSFAAIGGINYAVRVRSVGSLGDKSAWSSSANLTPVGDTVAPATPTGLSAIGGFGVIWLEWSSNTEPDFSHYEIYQSATSTPAPSAGTTATFQSSGNQLVISGLDNNITRHYWVRALDRSGNKSTWSSRVQATTTTIDLPDITPPTLGAPGTPSLSEVTQLDDAGNPIINIQATWTAGTNAVSYEIGVTQYGGNEVIFSVGGLRFSFAAIGGINYAVRARSVGSFGDKSAWSATANLTPVGDSVAPATPTGLTAVAGFKSIWLTWDTNTELDFKEYEIYEASTSSPAPSVGTAASFRVTGTTFVRTNLAAGTQRWYWIRAVDYSGNKSAWTASVNATAVQIQTVDVAGAIDLTSTAAGLTLPGSGPVLPSTPFTSATPKTFYNTTDKTVYVQKTDGTGWIPQTDATLIVGQIVAGQIAASAVGADQIAANSIRAKHLYLTDWTNLHGDGYFADGTTNSWTALPVGKTFVTGGTGYNGKTTYLDVTGANSALQAITFDVAIGRTYMVEAVVNRFSATAGTCRVSVQWLSETGAAIAVTQLDFTTSETLNTWVRKIGTYTVASGIVKGRIVVNNASTTISGGSYYVGYAAVTRMGDAELIVDGSITAAKVSTNQIITSSANIADAIITSAKIVSLDAAKIQAGTVLSGEVIVGGRAISALVDDAIYDDMREGNAPWILRAGSGAVSYASSSGYPTGGRGLILTNPVATELPGYTPFDSSKLYRVTARVWTSTATGGLYIGFTQFDAAKASLGIARPLANNIDQQGTVLGSAGWVDIVAYIKGTAVAATNAAGVTRSGSVATGTNNTIASPAKFITGTTWIRPEITANWAAGSGAIHVDMFRIEVLNEDAAQIVNAGTVKILPGQIEISGGTTLADWRQGGDTTKIAGGAISANTIDANRLRIGMRNITLEGITFEHNSPSANRVSWTAGAIRYINDAGATVSASIAANAAGSPWTTGVLYVHWIQGATSLSTTTDPATAFGSNSVVLATYQGGTALDADYGKTIIDGSDIKTGTVTANQIAANTIRARNLYITDYFNLAPDPYLGDANSWASVGANKNFVVDAGNGYAGRNTYMETTGAQSGLNSDYIDVAPGQDFILEAVANRYSATSGSFRVYAQWMNDALVSQGFVIIANWTTADALNTWVRKTATGTVPATATKVRILIDNAATTIAGGTYRLGYVALNRRSGAELIVDGSITADKLTSGEVITLSAQIKDAIITSAKIVSLDAGKITTGTLDAARIAANSITAEKINISGATTLADWRQGGDTTKIAGGSISTNTIDANKLNIGMRNIKLEGIVFEHNSPSANRVSWTGGTIRYINNAGTTTSVAIAAWPTGTLWTSGVVYIYWTQGAAFISATTDPAVAFGANNAVLATYEGGTALNADFGRTIIDGSNIKTGTVTADQIAANTIRAKNLYISDLVNLSPDPYFGDAASWIAVGSGQTFVTDNGNGYAGRNTYLELTGAQSSTIGDWVSVSPGQDFIIEAVGNRFSATSGSLRAYVQIANDVPTVVANAFVPSFTTSDALNTWVRKTVTATIPAGATRMRLVIDKAATTIAGGTYRLGYAAINRRSGAELIVDGAITAAKLTSGELITLSAQIKDAIITSAKIVSLDAAKIQAGSIMSGEVIIGGRSIGDIAAIDTVMDDMTRDRVKTQGTGTGVYSSAAANCVTGTRSFVSNDDGPAYWMPANILIPFDPSKLYKVTFKIRRGATTGGNMFMGVRGYAADQTTPVQIDGASGTNGHFVVASPLAQTTIPTTLTDYVGWIKGSAATGTHNGTIAVPSKMHTSVRYMTPYFIVNNSAAAGAGGSIVVDSIKIETIDENGAALINAGSVKITPGQIEISGSTTLADWRQGGDTTKIAGGSISTNTIDANKLTIGMRNIKVAGLQFEHNSPGNNQVSWTAGTITYINDAGVFTSVAITASNATWSAGTLYVYWVKGDTTLSTTTTGATAGAADNVILATYRGSTNLVVDIGRTVVDGSNIKTGTITATQLITTAALITSSAQIGNAVITSTKVENLSVRKIDDCD